MSRLTHPTKARAKRVAVAFLSAGVASTGLLAGVVAPAEAAPTGSVTDFGLQGASYGSKTTGNPTAHSDSTALSVLGCTRYIPRTAKQPLGRQEDRQGDEPEFRRELIVFEQEPDRLRR